MRYHVPCFLLILAGCGTDFAAPAQDDRNSLAASSVLSAENFTVSAMLNIQDLGPPFSDPLFVPCAQGGAGDLVVFRGQVHFLLHQTVDPQGGTHFTLTVNDVHVVGTGTSGQKYQAHGAVHFSSGLAAPGTVTFTLRATFVDLSSDVRVRLSIGGHTTLSPDGHLRAFFDRIAVDCDPVE